MAHTNIISDKVKNFIKENKDAINSKDFLELFINMYYEGKQLRDGEIFIILEMLSTCYGDTVDMYAERDRVLLYIIGRNIEQAVDEDETFPMTANHFLKRYMYSKLGYSEPAIVELMEENCSEWDMNIYERNGITYIDMMYDDMEIN